MYKKIIKEIKSHEDKERAKILARFFKTGIGQYGEGDLFLGIIVPISRKIATKYKDLSFEDISKLLKDKYHEVRLIALLILVIQYKSLNLEGLERTVLSKKKIVDFYLANTKYINNWDLVDLSAHYIVGDYLYNSCRTVLPGQSCKNGTRTVLARLTKLAKSRNIWDRRIAIISTFAFIYKGESKYTLYIVKMLLNDQHDLIQKACGWMLREVGKRVSEGNLTAFLDVYGTKMPRTMLRYAIERLPEKKRLYYLRLK